MTSRRWHISRDGDALTLARRRGARLDVSVMTTLPDAGRLRVAQQVRQDMWRALQDLRGFSPVVQVRRDAGMLHVTAGGEVAGRYVRDKVEAAIRDVLESPARRARWVAHARHKEVQNG